MDRIWIQHAGDETTQEGIAGMKGKKRTKQGNEEDAPGSKEM